LHFKSIQIVKISEISPNKNQMSRLFSLFEAISTLHSRPAYMSNLCERFFDQEKESQISARHRTES